MTIDIWHWAISWLCWVSSLDTEQPNEVVLCHATTYSTDRPIRSLMPRPHPHLCCAIQVIWLMAFRWLGTTKKSLNGSFHRERVGSGHETIRFCTYVRREVVHTLREFISTKYVHVLEICETNFYHPNMYPSWKFVPLQEICTPSGNLYSKICTPAGNLYPKICTPPGNLYTKMKYHR